MDKHYLHVEANSWRQNSGACTWVQEPTEEETKISNLVHSHASMIVLRFLCLTLVSELSVQVKSPLHFSPIQKLLSPSVELRADHPHHGGTHGCHGEIAGWLMRVVLEFSPLFVY